MPLKEMAIRLGKRELEIMQVVWVMGQATVRDVADHLSGPAYTTVLSMMRTLEKKGALEHVEDHRTFVYSAVISRENVQASMLMELRNVLFSGSSALLANSLFQDLPMSKREESALRDAFANALKNGKGHDGEPDS